MNTYLTTHSLLLKRTACHLNRVTHLDHVIDADPHVSKLQQAYGALHRDAFFKFVSRFIHSDLDRDIKVMALCQARFLSSSESGNLFEDSIATLAIRSGQHDLIHDLRGIDYSFAFDKGQHIREVNGTVHRRSPLVLATSIRRYHASSDDHLSLIRAMVTTSDEFAKDAGFESRSPDPRPLQRGTRPKLLGKGTAVFIASDHGLLPILTYFQSIGVSVGLDPGCTYDIGDMSGSIGVLKNTVHASNKGHRTTADYLRARKIDHDTRIIAQERQRRLPAYMGTIVEHTHV